MNTAEQIQLNNAQLLKDGEKDGIRNYTLKPLVGTKG